tara:strand:- start:891 stop:1151 length:261 start_codon:yes stop_codon:yes gene_type:complete
MIFTADQITLTQIDCSRTRRSEIDLTREMITGIAKGFHAKLLTAISLAAVVTVGIEQSKQPGIDRPVESKGALERYEESILMMQFH